MRMDHEEARSHVRAVREALGKNDADSAAGHLSAYRELLEGHVKKEDEVLYPWLDRNLSTTQVGALFSKFMSVDESFGDVPKNQEAFIEKIEAEFRSMETGAEGVKLASGR